MSFLKIIVLVIVSTGLPVSSSPLCAQSKSSHEYQVKAVFLYNFTQFVEWPTSSFSSGEAPMIIGILGNDPFGSFLEQTIAGEKINGHPLVIEHYKTVDEIEKCQVLFINIPAKDIRERAIEKLQGRNILTVGDTPDFMLDGGMIRFFIKQDKIKLQVNLEAAKTANLVISSKLLRLAEIFVPQKAG